MISRRKREQVLNLWVAGRKWLEISTMLDIPEETVRHYVRSARAKGDLRAVNRKTRHYRHRSFIAQQRTEQIVLLKKQGFKPCQISDILGISKWLVFKRLKEARDG